MGRQLVALAASIALSCLISCSSPKEGATSSPPRAREAPTAGKRTFGSYDEAKEYVRWTYDVERFDTSRSSWITGAEYFDADGRGYLILGMRGRDYIFEGVPPEVWEGFKAAPSLGRYHFDLGTGSDEMEDDQDSQDNERDPDEIYDTYRGR
jgi:hypothetical protein